MSPVSTSALNTLHTKKLPIPGYLIESPVFYSLGSLYLTFLFSDFFSNRDKKWARKAMISECCASRKKLSLPAAKQ